MSDFRNRIYKICIVGDGGVGKTTLLHRYVDGKFVEDTKMTIGSNFFIKKVEIPEKNTSITLQIWDLSGQEQFASIRTSFYLGAKGIIYTFDLSRYSTFNSLKDWKAELEDVIGKQTSVLVGNKLDIIDPEDRDIKIEDGLFLKESLNASDYFETSAKKNIDVENMFYKLALNILNSSKK
ncbi:MAG: Rab family GTPase [Promethearchaeota archaeon]